MRELSLTTWLGIVLLSGTALAGTPDGKGEPEGASLSGPEMVEQADKALAELQKAVSEIQAAYEEAEGGDDTLLSNCLGARLGEAKGLLKAGNEAKKAFDKAIADKNDAAATREYQKIVALQKKAGQVQQGASECGGATAEEDFEVPETEEASVTTQKIPLGRQPAASPTL